MSDSFAESASSQPSPASPSKHRLANSGLSNKENRRFNQQPLSPPLSVSASHVNASSPSSPQEIIFTPRSAPPMSAQTSQQGFTPASLSPGREPNPGSHNYDNDGDMIMQESPARNHQRTSSKHKLVDNDQIDSERVKRQRTDHDRETANETPITLGPSYKLGTSQIPLSRPHPTDDFFSLYSLNSIASSVARTDPKTGEKINQLKKSYKGKVKDLPGKNRAVSKPGELRGFLDYPDEEWHIQRVMGKELVKFDAQGNVDESWDPVEAIMSKVGNALKMQPGKLPGVENETWGDFLAYEDPASAKAAPAAAKGSKTQVQNATHEGASVAGQVPRSRRTGAKRHYNDESFEGYSKDFGDEYGDTDGDEDRGGQRRKRRKSNAPSAASSPRFSYNATTPGLSVGPLIGR